MFSYIQCFSLFLLIAFQALGDHVVEKYFQDVVAAVEQSLKHGAGGCINYLNSLLHVYRDILTASKEGVCVRHSAVLARISKSRDTNILSGFM